MHFTPIAAPVTSSPANGANRGLPAKARAAAFKDRMRAKGLEQANVWVPAELVSEIQILAAMLRDHPNLECGPLRDRISGKLVGIK